jgi:hypothetical protein
VKVPSWVLVGVLPAVILSISKPTGRRSRQHIARFILLALYTGTRAGAICGAALQPTVFNVAIELSFPGLNMVKFD